MAFIELLSLLTLKSTLIGLAVFFFVAWLIQRPRNLPPGPTGLPLVGYLPHLALKGNEYKTLTDIAKTYGDVFSLNLCGQLAVVLSSYEVIKKAFAHPNTSDRPPTSFYRDATPDPEALGVAAASGDSWLEQRKFSLTVLKGLGMGKASFEETVASEARGLVKEMKAREGRPFNPTHWICNAVSNVISSVTLGKTFEYSDDTFQKVLRMINRHFELAGGGSLYSFVPIMEYITFTATFKELKRNFHEILRFLKEHVDEHRQDWDPDNPRDFIDVFLGEVKNNEKNNVRSHLTPNNLLLTLFELFIGGAETTSSTLRWALLYMMANPEVQTRVQEEIDGVVGRNRLPRLTDKPELPYTEATIMEVQRLASVAALVLPHLLSQDTALFGYNIPKHTFLIANLWAVSRDPNIWPDPEKFSPDRFLGDDGKVKHREEHLPFSTGRRVCLGEQLAKMELFIFFSYFLHQFTFKKPDDAPPISFKIVNGFTLSPTPYEACVIPRA